MIFRFLCHGHPASLHGGERDKATILTESERSTSTFFDQFERVDDSIMISNAHKPPDHQLFSCQYWKFHRRNAGLERCSHGLAELIKHQDRTQRCF